MKTEPAMMGHWPGLISHYRSFLSLPDNASIVTLNEGNTPLVHSEKLSKLTKLDVYLKCEGANPTGSFKDRGMTMALTMAKHDGAKAVACASTGNTSASAAAYAARAGLRCFVLLPEGKVALGKLSQAIMCHAKVISIQGNFDDALRITRELTSQAPIALVNSVNPHRIEGQKTGAFEICDALGEAPDFHVMPVGNAGNITAYWKGYQDYSKAGKISALPKMIGFQAEGAAPIVRGKIVPDPQTFATAIRIGNPASWKNAELAKTESGGLINMVSDAQIEEAYRWLAREEGVFVEPASAASVAGLLKLSKDGHFTAADKGKKTVCILTGHGLKDPDSAMKVLQATKPVKADLKSVMKEIDL